MAMYHPIKGCSDDNDDPRIPDPAGLRLRRDHVESAAIQISEQTLSTATIVTDPIQQLHFRLPLDQKQQQRQRLASLDVFRGLTVVVCLFPLFYSLTVKCIPFMPSLLSQMYLLFLFSG